MANRRFASHLVVGFITIIGFAFAVVVLGAVVWILSSLQIRGSAVYRQAVDRAESMAKHQERLGTPSGAGLLIMGQAIFGRADFRVRFYGPKASTELRVRAREQHGRWHYSKLELLWREENLVEDLRTPEEKRDSVGSE